MTLTNRITLGSPYNLIQQRPKNVFSILNFYWFFFIVYTRCLSYMFIGRELLSYILKRGFYIICLYFLHWNCFVKTLASGWWYCFYQYFRIFKLIYKHLPKQCIKQLDPFNFKFVLFLIPIYINDWSNFNMITLV